MPKKALKISDVSGPGNTKPSASSRPIVVNHSMLARDPMMAPDAVPTDEQPSTAPTVTHSSKTIEPLAKTAPEPIVPETETPQQDNPETPQSTDAESTSEPEAAASSIEAPIESQAEEKNSIDEAASSEEIDAAAATAQAEAEAAKLARDQELEQLIASGKYAVPINSLQRKRSRMFVIEMCLLAVLLALFLVDISLDANIIHLPFSVPHTHFFSS